MSGIRVENEDWWGTHMMTVPTVPETEAWAYQYGNRRFRANFDSFDEAASYLMQTPGLIDGLIAPFQAILHSRNAKGCAESMTKEAGFSVWAADGRIVHQFLVRDFKDRCVAYMDHEDGRNVLVRGDVGWKKVSPSRNGP